MFLWQHFTISQEFVLSLSPLFTDDCLGVRDKLMCNTVVCIVCKLCLVAQQMGTSDSLQVCCGLWFKYDNSLRVENCKKMLQLFLAHPLALVLLQRVSIAMQSAVLAMIDSVWPSDRLSDRPSQSGIIPKRLQLRSCGLHWRIAPWL